MERRCHVGSVGDDTVHSATLALHAKLDELLRVDSGARSELARLDEQEPELFKAPGYRSTANGMAVVKSLRDSDCDFATGNSHTSSGKPAVATGEPDGDSPRRRIVPAPPGFDTGLPRSGHDLRAFQIQAPGVPSSDSGDTPCQLRRSVRPRSSASSSKPRPSLSARP
jgi:hypothetical protein